MTDKSRAVLSSIQGDLEPEKAWRVTLDKEGQAPALRNECRVILSDIEYPGGADAFPQKPERLIFLLLLVAVVEVATGGTGGRPDRGARPVLA